MTKAFVIVLLAVITLPACKKQQDTVAQTKPGTTATTKPDPEAITYLALGDSYTVGQSEPASVSFPQQLTNYLDNLLIPAKPPTIIATTGWTTYNLIHAIAQSNITNTKFDIVTLLIGVNDQYQGVDTSVYRTNFVTLLHTAVNFAKNDSTRVFVLSIPDYGVTPFANGQDAVIGPEIDQFNAINKQETLKAKVNYLDITGISREAATDTSLIAPDGLHPSAKMYALWIAQLGPMVAARLKK